MQSQTPPLLAAFRKLHGNPTVVRTGFKGDLMTFDIWPPDKAKPDLAGIRKVVSGRLQVQSIVYDGVADAAKGPDGAWWITCRGHETRMRLAKGDSDEPLKTVDQGVAKGSKRFKLSGDLKSVKDEGKDEVLELLLATAAIHVEPAEAK